MPGRVPYLWLCVALVVFGFAPPRTTVAADREDAVFSATEDHCGAEPHLEATLRRDPDLAARRALVEQIILEAQQNGLIPPKGASTNANPTYTVPTVVHIIHTGLNGRLLTVELALPKAGAVQLELYDVGGRRVRRVVRENVAAGRGLRVLDAAGLPSGLYLLRVETEGMVRTRRIVLLGP